MGYFRAPYWGNLIIRSSFSHIFIKRFSIPTWMPCIVLAVYSISVLRFQQYLRRLFLVSGQYIPLILFLDFSYVLIGERRFQIL
jgi:hypothetical protein